MNWQRGFFRAWVLVSIIWAGAWAVVVLAAATGKVEMARASDVELVPPGSPAPLMHSYLGRVLRPLGYQGRTVGRAVNVLFPELTILFVPAGMPAVARRARWMGL
jgi:hypothetical protein